MLLRTTTILLLGALLGGCVSTGPQDPLKTEEGRKAARDAYVQLGIGYLQKGSPSQAKVPLKKALEINSSDADAHAALALVFQAEREPKLADEHYRQALSSRRDDARILNNYGSFLYEQQRYPEAYERFQQAAADNLYVERPRVFENLGLTALQMGQRQLAMEHFDKALRLDRNRPRALLAMAQLSWEDRQYVPARGYYDRFLALKAPQDARSLLLGVRLAKVFQDRDRAANFGMQLQRLYPGTAEYQQYLAEQK